MQHIILTGLQRRTFLQWSCNKFGDFKVATHRPDGSWTKHKSVLEIWHNENEFWRLDKANNRGLFPCEIVLDLDLEKGETKEQIKERFENVCKILTEKDYKFYGYFSGSKGYHIHMIFYELVQYPHKKKEFREYFIKLFGADLMKSSAKSMIALEATPHWKTGIPKQLVKYNASVLPEPEESIAK